MGGDVTTRCKSCGAMIFWAMPRGGSVAMIFDEEPKHPGVGRWVLERGGKCHTWAPMFDGYELETYEPHWATCPDADAWRQRGFPQMETAG